MSLKHLSDRELLERLRKLTRQERALQAELIEFIREVDSRKLYRDLGYSNLFEYMTRGLKYSEGAAQRRIDAARLSASVPEACAKLKSGEVSLMSLARLQSLIRIEEKRSGKKLGVNTKKQLIKEISGKSSDEVRTALFTALPEASLALEKKKKEGLYPVGIANSRLTVTLNEKLKRKLERAREVAARSLQDPGSWAELIEHLVDDFLERHDPMVKAERILKKNPTGKPQRTATVAADPNKQQNFMRKKSREKNLSSVASPQERSKGGNFSFPDASQNSLSPEPSTAKVAAKRQPKRQPIPTSIRHAVWIRDKGCCQFKDPTSGVQCQSRRYLEIDHVIPGAKGGTNDIDNLRLLCRAHNQFRAEKTFRIRPWRTIPRHQLRNAKRQHATQTTA